VKLNALLEMTCPLSDNLGGPPEQKNTFPALIAKKV